MQQQQQQPWWLSLNGSLSLAAFAAPMYLIQFVLSCFVVHQYPAPLYFGHCSLVQAAPADAARVYTSAFLASFQFSNWLAEPACVSSVGLLLHSVSLFSSQPWRVVALNASTAGLAFLCRTFKGWQSASSAAFSPVKMICVAFPPVLVLPVRLVVVARMLTASRYLRSTSVQVVVLVTGQ